MLLLLLLARVFWEQVSSPGVDLRLAADGCWRSPSSVRDGPMFVCCLCICLDLLLYLHLYLAVVLWLLFAYGDRLVVERK